MIFSIAIAIVFAFAAIVCYASCCAGAKTDRQSEEYFALKEQERKSENLKDFKN